jgi:hypothetical protein
MQGYMNLYSVTHSPYIRQQQDFRAALTLNRIHTPVRARQFSILHISQDASTKVLQKLCF